MTPVSWLKNTYEDIRKLSQIRWLRIAVQVVIFSLCAYYIWKKLSQAESVITNIQIDAGILCAALLVSIAAGYLGALAWWLFLLSLGQPVAIIETFRNQLLSNLAKYLPGYGWQLLGKAYLTRKQGVPANLIGFGMILELVIMFSLGIVVALIFLNDQLLEQLTGQFSIQNIVESFRYVLLVAVLLAIVLFPVFLNKIKQNGLGLQMNIPTYWIGVIVVLVGWLVLGLSFWLLGAAISPIPFHDFPLFTFTLAASILIGLVILFVPAGIGIRESVMIFLLGPLIGAQLAIIIAAACRFLFILSDIASLIPIEIVYRIQKHRQTNVG